MRLFAMYRLLFLATLLVLCSLATQGGESALAATRDDQEVAQRLCDALFERFSPEEVQVTVNEDRAFVQARGILLDGVRVELIRLDARIDRSSRDLESMVRSSMGELTLLERDVNDFFARNERSGFSNLSFRLLEDRFEAQGIYNAKFISSIRIRLRAEGILALRDHGIVLDRVGFYIEGRRQPEAFTEQILKSLNPLLSTSDLPFPVRFREVRMSRGSVSLLSGLKPFEGATVRRSR